MRDLSQGKFRQQISFLRRQFLQEGDLPFRDVLSEELVQDALAAVRAVWNDAIYTPLVTLWVFLSQVLSADHSCRSAVARLIAHRISRGQRACSSETGAYCQAGKRLPEQFFADVACRVGRVLDSQVARNWLWKGRQVYMFDGTTVSMPDTQENLKAYPKTYNQKAGQGFPLARVGALISLSCGAILNVGFCRYAGKGQGEVSLLRRMWDILRPGDVIPGDSLMSNWTGIVMLKERGFELVSRLNKAHRKADFRKGKRLGPDDHIVCWQKPTSIRSVAVDIRQANGSYFPTSHPCNQLQLDHSPYLPRNTSLDSSDVGRLNWLNAFRFRGFRSAKSKSRNSFAGCVDFGEDQLGTARSSPPFSAGSMRALEGRFLHAFTSCDCFLQKI